MHNLKKNSFSFRQILEYSKLMDNKGLPWKQFCILDGRCSAAARGDWDGTATGRDTNVNTEGRIPKQC